MIIKIPEEYRDNVRRLARNRRMAKLELAFEQAHEDLSNYIDEICGPSTKDKQKSLDIKTMEIIIDDNHQVPCLYTLEQIIGWKWRPLG